MKFIKALFLGLSLLGLTACGNTETVRPTFYINENGHLIEVYNGEETDLGLVKGQDGKDGTDGKDGKDGVDGKDGKDGKDGQDGEVIYVDTSGHEEPQPDQPDYTFYTIEFIPEDTRYEVRSLVEFGASTTSSGWCGSITTKPGVLIKDIWVGNKNKMAQPYVLDKNYNVIQYRDKVGAALNFTYTDIYQENITIKFNHFESVMNDYYGPEKIRLTYALVETFELPQEFPQIEYGYAGLAIYNGSDTIYKVGLLGESVTSKELENFVLSFYPGYKIASKNYTSFTTTYQAVKFTTRKITLAKQ